MITYSELSLSLLVLLVILGLVALMLGGDWLCKGAASIARLFHINPVVIGLTVVSIATSMPELFTVYIAASENNPDMAISNILGSNLGNIGLILGLTALIYPLKIQRRLIIKEMPILLAATLVFSATSFDGHINRIEGLLLVIGLAGYMIYLANTAKHSDDELKEEVLDEMPSQVDSVSNCVLLIILGTALLGVGAEILVKSAVEVARLLDISKVLVGMTMVAIGTSLPELAASIAAARRRQSGICAGNIVGSNLFNLMFVGGSVAAIEGITITRSLFQVEFPAMLLMTALLWLMFTTDRRVTRLEGIVLLTIYSFILILSGISHSNITLDSAIGLF